MWKDEYDSRRAGNRFVSDLIIYAINYSVQGVQFAQLMYLVRAERRLPE